MPTSSYQEMLDEFDPIGSRSSTPIASAPAPSSGIRASLHAVQPAAAPATATDRPFDVGAAPGSRDSPEEARGLGRTSGGGRGLGDEPSGNDLIGEYTMSSLLATGSELSHAGRGTGKAPLSPPRRMASLMDLVPPPSSNVQYHSTKAMSIPQLSSPSLDDFHPSSPPSTSSAVDSFDDYFFKSSLFTGQDQDEIDPATNLSASPDWSEFQTADAGGFSSSPPLPELPSPRSRLSPRALSDSIASGLGRKTRRAPKAPPPAPDTTWKEEWTYDAKGADAVQPIVLKGVSPGLERALQEDIAEGIRPNLPARLRISTRWKLLYSLDQHGTSLKTMYECMEEVLGELDGGCVLVVKDTRGAIFGAYINEGLREQRSYYGDGSCFLWKATPFGPADFRVGHSVKSFKWTGRNEYYILTDSRSISVGGGDGRFGLWIDGVFEKGYSSRCPCFGNDPLVERYAKGPSGVDEAEFDVLSFEIWSVGG